MAEGAPAVPLLYEDDALVVVDKPSGVPVIPAPGLAAGASVQHRVAARLGTRLWVVHRLDRDTSGALAFARTAEAHRMLSIAFERRDVRKEYLALVAGVPEPREGAIDLPLHEARRGKMRPAAVGEAGARPALTEYAVRRAWRRADGLAVALVAAWPHTGRHHQLRVHFRAIGTPIVHDAQYARGVPLAADAPCQRLALHAHRLDLPHPRDGRRVQVTSPLAPDLQALVEWLDQQTVWEAVP